MSSVVWRILHLEDCDNDAELIRARLRQAGDTFEVSRVANRDEFVTALNRSSFDLILSDYHLPSWSGLDALQIARTLQPTTPFIFLSGMLGEDLAVETLKLGATDYVLKARLNRLIPAVSRALNEAEARLKREETERALRTSEANLRFLADSMPQIVWTARADGSIDYFNQRWQLVTGLDPVASLEPDVWSAVVHPDDRAECRSRWGESVAKGVPFELEFRLRDQCGVFRWFLGRAQPATSMDGAVGQWFGTCTDIDEQRRLLKERDALLTSERAARAEAEKASRSKDEFLAVLSHELRTPLNAILGWTQLLRRKFAQHGGVQEGLQIIERNARIQIQLIEDLLDMSRVLSGKLSLSIDEVDVVALVTAAISTVQHAAEAKGVAIALSQVGQRIRVMGDAGRLQQVVWNLLTNAIKFSEAGGQVLVSTSVTDGVARIAVQDQGQGIRAEFLPYVFDRFRQADGGISRRNGGLGIGLAVVKHLVAAHNGSVFVTSGGEGAGATFTVELPHVESGGRFSSTSESSGWSEDSLIGVRVLLVEDDDDSREFLKRILEDHGASVVACSSAQDAMNILEDHIDVIVSDIGMPTIDGYTFLRSVRAQRDSRRSRIPAIALTAFARPEDCASALEAGFQRHVTKPVDPTRIAATVAEVARITVRT